MLHWYIRFNPMLDFVNVVDKIIYEYIVLIYLVCHKSFAKKNGNYFTLRLYYRVLVNKWKTRTFFTYIITTISFHCISLKTWFPRSLHSNFVNHWKYTSKLFMHKIFKKKFHLKSYLGPFKLETYLNDLEKKLPIPNFFDLDLINLYLNRCKNIVYAITIDSFGDQTAFKIIPKINDIKHW